MNGDDQRDNMSDVILFYSGEESSSSYTLQEIWNFSDKELEQIHNHIQWLFPTNDPRNKDTGKPFLTDEDIVEFKNNKKIQDYLWDSYDKMLGFYGIAHNGKDSGLIKAEDFSIRSNNWLNKGNHNYLRLTRIISCLKLCGLEKEAQSLFSFLSKLYEEFPNKIGDTTFNFWQKAIDGTLYEGYVDNSIQIKDLKSKLGSINWS